MTTIAYKAGTLASDSLITFADVRYSKASNKVKRLANGALVGWSGDLVSGCRLVAALEKNGGKITDQLLAKCGGLFGLYVYPDGRVLALKGGDEGGSALLEGDCFAEGSGYVSALAAMKAGAGAVRAIEIACELDINSSLPVVAVQLDTAQWKPVKKRGKR